MPNLSSFFQPLNFVNISIYLFALIFFEVFGTFIKHYFVKDEKVNLETHIVNWLIGLGIFVFVWFIAGFIITPTQLNIQISILIMFGVSLPYYISHKEYISLFSNLKSLVLPIILFLPFLRPVFVKASLPPYVWDEMAYHFISPYVSLHNIGQFWHFGNGGLYGELPRLMDTLYILSFSLTNTYSVVRLIQFSILVTSILCAFLLIKKTFGRISAFLFILIFLGLPIAIPTLATIGYVDVVAMSMLLMGFMCGITFFYSNNPNYIILSLIFWAMSLGTKYTTLVAFIAFLFSLGIVYWIKYRSFKNILNKKIIVRIVIALIVFGGYWYIKNFVIYGNPIYPFLFNCWGKFAQTCPTGSSFFGTWTGPVNIYTFYSIISSLLPGNAILHFVFVLSPFLVILFGDRKNKLILLMLALSFTLEIIFMKYFSGFESRYQKYLMFTLIFPVILFISMKVNVFTVHFFQKIILIVLSISCIILYFKNVFYLNSKKYLSSGEINYALGREDVHDWIKGALPEVSEAVFWCDNQQDDPVALANFDPEMVWSSYSGLMRVYLTGCYYKDPDIKPEEWKDFELIAKERKLQFWTVSINDCGENNEETSMWRLNDKILCHSIEVVPNLFYFDYKKLR